MAEQETRKGMPIRHTLFCVWCTCDPGNIFMPFLISNDDGEVTFCFVLSVKFNMPRFPSFLLCHF